MGTINYKDPSLLANLAANGVMSSADKNKLNGLTSGMQDILIALDGYGAPPDLDGYATTAEVQAETNRAVAVEQTILTALDGYGVPQSLDGYATLVDLQGETNRALAAEQEIKSALDGYNSIGTCGEATLVDGYVAVSLPGAIPVDAKVMWSRKTPLGQIGDVSLGSQTTNEFSLVSSSEYDQSIMTWTINSIVTGALVIGTTSGTAADGGLLQSEISRAEAAEALIRQTLDGYGVPQSLDGYATTVELQAETNRAIGAENQIKTALDGYTTQTYVDGYAASIIASVAAETNRAIAEENIIKAALDGYSGGGGGSADGYATVVYVDGYASSIISLVTAETNRAVAEENIIKSALDGYSGGGGGTGALRTTVTDGYTQILWTCDELAAPFANTGVGGTLDLTVPSGNSIIAGTPGIFGNCARAVTSVHFASMMTADTSIGESSSITLSAWTRLYSGGGGISLIAKNYHTGDTWSAPYPSAAIFIDASGVINFSWSTSARAVSTPANSLVNWTFVAATYNATTGVAIVYINGLQAATTTITPASIDWGFNGPWGSNAGFVDDIRIESTIRSQNYLLQQYQQGIGLFT